MPGGAGGSLAETGVVGETSTSQGSETETNVGDVPGKAPEVSETSGQEPPATSETSGQKPPAISETSGQEPPATSETFGQEPPETAATSGQEPSDNEDEGDAAAFYTIPTPEGYIFGLYEWDSKLLLYTYEGDAYRLTLVDPADGAAIAQTREDFQGTLWIGFSEPLAETPDKAKASAHGGGEALSETSDTGLLPAPSETSGSVQNPAPSETPESGLLPTPSETSDSGQNPAASETAESDLILAAPENPDILIHDGIFNSGGETDVPAGTEPSAKGDVPMMATESEKSAAPSRQLRIFDSVGNRFLWLDQTLTIVDTFEMPEQVSYQPQMDEHNEYIYYVNLDGEVIQLERQTGATRTYETGMKLYSQPNLEGLYDDGQLLVVSGLAETEGGDSVVFIQNYLDVTTGAQLYQSKSFTSLTGAGGQYVMTMSGDIIRAVTGTFQPQGDYTEGNDAEATAGGDPGADALANDDTHDPGIAPHEFIFKYYDEYQSMFSFPESGRIVTFHSEALADGSFCGMLSMYSMDNGRKLSAWEIPAEVGNGVNLRPLYMVWLPETEQLAFAVSNDSGQLCVWDPDHPESQCKDTGVYKRSVMADDDPEALALQKSVADTLSQQYDIEIYVGEDCPTQLLGYKARQMTDVPVIQRALMILDQALEKYPDGFFGQLANERQGRLKFYILGDLFPDGGDSLETTVGLFTQEESKQYISLNALNPDQLEALIYHEVTHAIDNKLFGISNQTYHSPQWDALNPPGFSYDFSYQNNARQPGRDYIYGMSLYSENPTEVYFIDNYSRSYPTEDRARIMEYAMGRYPWENCFTETHLRDKLDYISRDIRNHFDTSGWPEIAWWERALTN